MRALAVGVIVLAAVPSAHGQSGDTSAAFSASFAVPPGIAATELQPPALLPRVPKPQWWAPLASAAAPGSGQAALGQKRWLPYLALEVWAWIQYVDARRDGGRRRREYQLLARDVARSRYPGPYPVGDFEYYEHMLKNPESGDFDLVPGGPVDPETDTTTYNGRRWLDARRLYWENPDAPPPLDSPAYLSAMDFYRLNAVPTLYRWSWRSARLEYDVFRRAIVRSNVEFKRSVEYLGLIIANHALSAVDAFVTLRLRTREDIPGQLELHGELPLGSILPRH